MKLLIIRAGALGDTLMLMPSINGLKRDVEITIVGRRPGIDYLRPYVDRCIDMETSGWHRLFMKDTEELTNPSFPPADHVIAFMNDPDDRVRGTLNKWFPESAINIFPVFPPKGDDNHIALYMARAIQEAGLPLDAIKAFEDSLKTPLLKGRSSGSIKTGCLVLHPGSGSEKKNYPPDFWVKLIMDLKSLGFNKRMRFILLLGPAEEGLFTFFKDNLNERDVEFKVLPDQEELLSILGNASTYIGHDSGVTHLAAMLGIHVIALFKDTSIEQWRPLGSKVIIIKN